LLLPFHFLAAFLKQIHDVHNMYSLDPGTKPIKTNQFSSAFHSFRVATHRLTALDTLLQGQQQAVQHGQVPQGDPPQQQHQDQQQPGQQLEGQEQQPPQQQEQHGQAPEDDPPQHQHQALPADDFFGDCPVCSAQGGAVRVFV
jgi:hypothetical protein